MDLDDDYEDYDDLGEAEPRGFDLDLLLSVAGGLGRHQYTEAGRKVYEKDPDCLGALRRWRRRSSRRATCALRRKQWNRRYLSRTAAPAPPAARRRRAAAALIAVRPAAPAACLKDLQRFLRRDSPDTRDAFFKLGELQVQGRGLISRRPQWLANASICPKTCQMQRVAAGGGRRRRAGSAHACRQQSCWGRLTHATARPAPPSDRELQPGAAAGDVPTRRRPSL
jgi:hypothetical protein